MLRTFIKLFPNRKYINKIRTILWIYIIVVLLCSPHSYYKYFETSIPRCAPFPPEATTSEESEPKAGQPPRSPASRCPASPVHSWDPCVGCRLCYQNVAEADMLPATERSGPVRMSAYRSRWRNASPCPGRAASQCPRSLASRCLRRPAPPCQCRLPPRWPRRSAAVIQLGGRGGMAARRGGGSDNSQ